MQAYCVHILSNRRLLRWLAVLSGFSLILWLFGLPHRPALSPRLTLHQPAQDTPTQAVLADRASAVRNAFQHAYAGYEKYAWSHDELLPVTGGKTDNFNGWSVTMIDAMDTMWIMDLKEEFRKAVDLAKTLKFVGANDGFVPFFETVIRYLGGFLSAYALSGEQSLLSLADDLGSRLLPALDTESGFPKYAVNTQNGRTRMGWTPYALLAEGLSNQMEYKYLAHLTGKQEYYKKVEGIMTTVRAANITDGMLPTMWDISTSRPSNNIFSVGAFADSAHEYLLKQWLLSGKSEPIPRDLYLKVANSIIDKLLFVTPNRGILYVTDISGTYPSHKFEHLSCFLPGLLALGVHTLDLDARDRQRHLWAAKGLAYACWISYADQATGLGPDEMIMTHSPSSEQKEGKWVALLQQWESRGSHGIPPGLTQYPPENDPKKRDYYPNKSGYLLRPETIESFYILWKTTGDSIWRERAWAVFQAIESHCKTDYGYASLGAVDVVPAPKKNEMPSYFLAETLKYLYLIFSEDDIIPLDRWVLNTEAHPLPVFNWTDEEKTAYNLV